eukprot:CAMPEP_0185598750 /NCGR_PEP_ID=MMETSP0434-20130131/82216_1 /TAXON_ID=626734 ORGANISM="Favella taraikaensis, Strain Fe Narragansett Bay" /NCGR_SAMPLE_ID=MMETSP0434 /ASSEMBLY_ACC=CAM_ASM_000379 /LENGTH=88 /DNA_ID=CAMNT_0028227859 /DNA_START=704 /DNA_END=967 /DNA_ORIENTATION=-
MRAVTSPRNNSEINTLVSAVDSEDEFLKAFEIGVVKELRKLEDESTREENIIYSPSTRVSDTLLTRGTSGVCSHSMIDITNEERQTLV